MREPARSVPVEMEKQPTERFPAPEQCIAALEIAGMTEHVRAFKAMLNVAEAIRQAGGTALLIGGSVRDVFFGRLPKDYDLEVYGLDPELIESLARPHGKIQEVGRAFGILKMTVALGLDIDISLPRKDSKIGEGHRGFEVKTDKDMSIHEAARRRDFTINTVAANPLTGQFYDTWNGLEDIRNRRLRVTDEERFKDDPLRVLRGVQFIGRFGLEPDEDCIRIMRDTALSLKELPKERILGEWKKLLLQSEKPSLGLAAAATMGVLRELYPELLELRGSTGETLRDAGDPWMRMLSEMDHAASIMRAEKLNDASALILALSVFVDAIGSNTHQNKAQTFIASLGPDTLTRDKLLQLLHSDVKIDQLYLEATKEGKNLDGTIRRLAKSLFPATIAELARIAECQAIARRMLQEETSTDLLLPTEVYPVRAWLLEQARRLGVETGKPADLTQGRDWITRGFKPGIHIGTLVTLSNDLRDDKQFTREQVFTAVKDSKTPQDAIAVLQLLLT